MEAGKYCRLFGVQVGDKLFAAYWEGAATVSEIHEEYVLLQLKSGRLRAIYSLPDTTRREPDRKV